MNHISGPRGLNHRQPCGAGLVNNIWSFAGDDDRAKVNQLLIQPFINYNLGRGLAIGSAPIITTNWEAPSGQKCDRGR